jgi:hypothetical protein
MLYSYSRTQKILIFLILFAGVGASLGTATLLGPVAYITRILREAKTDPSVEKIAVNSIILLLIALTGIISGLITTFYTRSEFKYKMIVLLLGSALFFVVPMGLFMNPETMKPFMPPESKVANFVFGPYPDEQIMAKIKSEEYTAIISLLHPAVLPFEPELLKREEESCAKAGVTLIKAPMLPWISENKDSLETIAKIAQSKKGKYYIHCYLGRDRVHMAKKVIEKYNKDIDAKAVTSSRSIDSKKFFERGDIYKFTGEIYLTPYPTDEEFVSYVLGQNFKSIVCLLNSADEGDNRLIEKEKDIIKMVPIELILFPIPSDCEDAAVYEKALEKIKAAPKPTLVHGFKVSSKREKAVIELLKK